MAWRIWKVYRGEAILADGGKQYDTPEETLKAYFRWKEFHKWSEVSVEIEEMFA